MALLLTTATLRGLLTRPSWVVTKKISTFKTKGQVGASICAAYDNTAKVKHAQRNNSNAEKVVGKHITTNLSTNIQMFNQSLINRRSQLQCIINNKANTEYRKTKILQQMINTANTAFKNVKCNITSGKHCGIHVYDLVYAREHIPRGRNYLDENQWASCVCAVITATAAKQPQPCCREQK